MKIAERLFIIIAQSSKGSNVVAKRKKIKCKGEQTNGKELHNCRSGSDYR